MDRIKHNCLVCGQIFWPPLWQVNRGGGKFCSVPCANSHMRKEIDLNQIIKEYEGGMTAMEIGENHGVSDTVIRRRLHEEGKMRSIYETMQLRGRHIEFTREQRDILEGLLIGDGSITRQGGLYCGARYCHGDVHQKYISWLWYLLEGWGLSLGKMHGRKLKRKSNGFSTLWQFETHSHHGGLVSLRERWYPQGKKHIPKDLVLTPNMLKFWYIGDGSAHNLDRPGSKVIICNRSFSNKSLATTIIPQLKEHGIESRVHASLNIFFPKESHHRFFQYVLSDDPEIPPGYAYKFPKEFRP